MADLRSTLFVGNLSVFCTEHDIEQLFSTYGVILEIRMAKSEDKSKHLSYGFVKFASVASAQLAMHELNGALLCGRPLKIGKAFSRSNKKCFGGPPSDPEYNTASVHVTFISHQLFRIVNEESLRHLFTQFGPVVDAVICKSNIDQSQNRQSGYGFIHFPGTVEGIEASFKAAEVLMDVMIDEVNYKCKISHHLEKHLKDPMDPQVPVIEESYLDTPQFPPHLMHLPESVPLNNSNVQLNMGLNMGRGSLPPNPSKHISSNSSVSSGMTTLISSLTDGSNDQFFEMNMMNRSNHGLSGGRNISIQPSMQQGMPQQLGGLGRQSMGGGYGNGNGMIDGMQSRLPGVSSGYGQQQFGGNSIDPRMMNVNKMSPYAQQQQQTMSRFAPNGMNMNMNVSNMNNNSHNPYATSQSMRQQSFHPSHGSPSIYQQQQSALPMQPGGMKHLNHRPQNQFNANMNVGSGLGGNGVSNYYSGSSMHSGGVSKQNNDLVDSFGKLDLGNYSIIPPVMDSLTDNFSQHSSQPHQPSHPSSSLLASNNSSNSAVVGALNSRDFSAPFPGNLPPPPTLSSPILSTSVSASAASSAVSAIASSSIGTGGVGGYEQGLGSAFSLSSSLTGNGNSNVLTGDSLSELKSSPQDFDSNPNDLFTNATDIDYATAAIDVLASTE